MIATRFTARHPEHDDSNVNSSFGKHTTIGGKDFHGLSAFITLGHVQRKKCSSANLVHA